MSSDRIENLDAGAEVFYRRLMSKVDDFGFFDARPSILRSSLYPLRVDRVREADIARWIAACEKAGVIALYQHAGKPFLQMLDTDWQTRSEPKFPLPPWGKSKHSEWSVNNRSQPLTAVTVFGVEGVAEDVTPKPPRGADARFERFWKSYPAKVAKDTARKAFDKRKPDDAMVDRMVAALEVQRNCAKWTKDGGQYIPNPATWLNGACWEDGNAGDGSQEIEDWHATLGGVKRMAESLGLEPWEEAREPWPAFKTRVLAAAKETA